MVFFSFLVFNGFFEPSNFHNSYLSINEINLLNLEIVAQTGPTGKLFGSVTNSQIASSIEENLDGVTIDRRSIRITQPIKMIGSYKVPMKLFEGVDAEVNLLVKSAHISPSHCFHNWQK